MEQTADDAASAAQQPGVAGQPTVSIIDDDGTSNHMITTALEAAGYRVVASGKGQDGLAQVVAEKPALVLLDLRLPDMTGLEVLQKLRAKDTTKRLPVVLMTNAYEVDIMNQAMELGVRDYILKSDVRLEEITKLVASYVPVGPS